MNWADASATPCTAQHAVHAILAKQIAHIYNQIATDGEDSFSSYFARGEVQSGEFAGAIQTHDSEYDSQHAGAQTFTVVHTISGATVSVPWFVANDRTSEAHAAVCTRFARLYAGAAYVLASSSYSYPIGHGSLHGFGAGLERFADANRRFDVFGSLYYYPAVSGSYGPGSVSYALVSFDGALRWRLGSSGVGLIAGLYEEMRTLRPGARAGFMIRDGPYIGIGLNL